MRVAVCFTNFGPYHLARLRALGESLGSMGGHLIAYELADAEQRYPWARQAGSEPFTWTTLFTGRPMESIRRDEARRAMTQALDRDRPDVVGVVGYARPESMAAIRWSRRANRPAILLSESQEIDHPRTWWKEAIKRPRVKACSAALVGGPRHRDYLVQLGMPPSRIALGYNAVDNAAFTRWASEARARPDSRSGLPTRPYFIAVSRFVPEKNLVGLVEAYTQYRAQAGSAEAWDLVLCGGGPGAGPIHDAIAASNCPHSIHCPGFLQGEDLARWLAGASSFVHPSRMEPWGLVVNEAAAVGLPLLVSDRAGCVETFVPEPAFDPSLLTGRRFDPADRDDLTTALAWMAAASATDRQMMGANAARIVGEWGPERFANGMLEAIRSTRSLRLPRSEATGPHRDLLAHRGNQ